LSCAGIGIPEDPALLIGAAILASLVLKKAFLSIGLLYLWYKGMHSVGALEFFCAYNPNAIICVGTWETKTIFLNRQRRPDSAEASFDGSDFPQQAGGTSPQLLQDLVLQGFYKWKLWLLQVTLQCTFCLHRAVKKIGRELWAFYRGYPRPYRMQNVKPQINICYNPCRVRISH
jgi:hypothetical protein